LPKIDPLKEGAFIQDPHPFPPPTVDTVGTVSATRGLSFTKSLALAAPNSKGLLSGGELVHRQACGCRQEEGCSLGLVASVVSAHEKTLDGHKTT